MNQTFQVLHLVVNSGSSKKIIFFNICGFKLFLELALSYVFTKYKLWVICMWKEWKKKKNIEFKFIV